MHVEQACGCVVQRTRIASCPLVQQLGERPFGRTLPAGTMRDDQMREPEDLAPTMPARETKERVHTERQHERCRTLLATQLGEGVDGVTATAAAHLAIVDHESGLIGDGGAVLGRPRALGLWGPLVLGPTGMLWRLKRALDQRFLARLRRQGG